MALGTINTNQIASKAVTVPKVTDQVLSSRNLITNGAMQVAQRGTSSTSNGYNTVDRWRPASLNTDELVNTFSQSTDAPSGFSNSFKYNVDTAETALAGNELVQFETKLEGQNLQMIAKGTSDAKPLTLSFWVKSTTTGTFTVEIEDKDNTRSCSQDYTINSANTWEYKTLSFPVDTTGTLDNDNAESLRVNFALAAGSNFTSGTLATSWASKTTANRFVGQTNLIASANNNWYITGVQLEVGEATPFEHRSYGEELARCQRYYQENDWTTNQVPSLHRFDNTGLPYNFFSFLCEMRSSPTFTQSGSWNSSNGNAGTPTLHGASTVGATLRGNNGTIAANTGQWVRGGIVKFDAEL